MEGERVGTRRGRMKQRGQRQKEQGACLLLETPSCSLPPAKVPLMSLDPLHCPFWLTSHELLQHYLVSDIIDFASSHLQHISLFLESCLLKVSEQKCCWCCPGMHPASDPGYRIACFRSGYSSRLVTGSCWAMSWDSQ